MKEAAGWKSFAGSENRSAKTLSQDKGREVLGVDCVGPGGPWEGLGLFSPSDNVSCESSEQWRVVTTQEAMGALWLPWGEQTTFCVYVYV